MTRRVVHVTVVLVVLASSTLARAAGAAPKLPFEFEDPWAAVSLGPGVTLNFGGGTRLRLGLAAGIGTSIEVEQVEVDFFVPLTYSHQSIRSFGLRIGQVDLGLAVRGLVKDLGIFRPYGLFVLGFFHQWATVPVTFEGYQRVSFTGAMFRFGAGVEVSMGEQLLLTFEPLIMSVYMGGGGTASEYSLMVGAGVRL